MSKLLLSIGFSYEQIDEITKYLNKYPLFKIEQVIKLMQRYNCNNEFIREVFINKVKIFEYEIERLEYLFDTIHANGDIIEEILFELI